MYARFHVNAFKHTLPTNTDLLSHNIYSLKRMPSCSRSTDFHSTPNHCFFILVFISVFPIYDALQMPSSGSVSSQTPPFSSPSLGTLQACDALALLPLYSSYFYMMTCFVFTVYVLPVFFSDQNWLTVTVL